MESQNNLIESSKKILLDVGGNFFSTTLETLRKFPNSYLATLFSNENINKHQNENERFFIDRDGSYFRIILNYLRDNEIDLNSLNNNQKREILKEAKFYGLTDLVKIIEESEKQDQLNNKINIEENNIEMLKEKNKKQVEELLKMLEYSHKLREALEGEINDLKQRVNDVELNGSLQKMENLHAQLNQKVIDLNLEIDQYKKKERKWNKEKAEMEEKFQKMEQQLNSIKLENDKEFQKQFEEEKKNYEIKINNYIKELNDLKQQIQEKDQTFQIKTQNSEKELKQLKELNLNLEKKLKKYKKKFTKNNQEKELNNPHNSITMS